MNEIYDDERETIKLFFRLSIRNKLNKFNYRKAFNVLLPRLEEHLSSHGLLGKKKYGDMWDQFYDLDIELSKLTIKTDYLHIDLEDLRKVILKLYYKKSKQAFTQLFEHLIVLYYNIKNNSYDDNIKNMELFDLLIHSYHMNGDLFPYNMDDLREEAEEV